MTETSHPRSARGRTAIIMLVGIAIIGAAIFYANAAGQTSAVKLAIITNHEGAFFDPVIKGAMDAAAEANVELVVVRSKPDAQEQTAHLQKVIAQGANGVAISAINPTSQQAALDEAAAKTVLITFDSDAPNT